MINIFSMDNWNQVAKTWRQLCDFPVFLVFCFAFRDFLFRVVLRSLQSEAESTGISHLLPAPTLCYLPHYQQPPPERYIG